MKDVIQGGKPIWNFVIGTWHAQELGQYPPYRRIVTFHYKIPEQIYNHKNTFIQLKILFPTGKCKYFKLSNINVWKKLYINKILFVGHDDLRDFSTGQWPVSGTILSNIFDLNF